MSWQFGLVVVVALPVVVLVAAVVWPVRVPKERTVGAIRDRIEREGPEG
ncbi:hypothetical protein GCM10027089_00930 [Nocardia thraciensis]